jgi:hypothetical protein
VRVQVELQVLDVCKADLLEGAGAAAAVLEVGLLEGFSRRRSSLAPCSWTPKRRAG